MKLPLTATVLNKRSSITIIGSVGDYRAQIELTLADQSIVRPEVDENGSFLIDIDWKKAHGDILVKAMLPEHPEVTNETVLHVQAPEPIVTAVLSTQGITRKLTGSVNQPGLFIEVHTPENTHPIEVLIDDKLEFELQIPIALRPEDLRVTALNPVTGEQMEVPVEIGVTTKTMTIPILTDDMINSYADAAEGRRAASAAYDHSLMEKAAASESFVNSIVESISPDENTQSRAELEEIQATEINSPVEPDMNQEIQSEPILATDFESSKMEDSTMFDDKLITTIQTIQVEVLQPHFIDSVKDTTVEPEKDAKFEDEELVPEPEQDAKFEDEESVPEPEKDAKFEDEELVPEPEQDAKFEDEELVVDSEEDIEFEDEDTIVESESDIEFEDFEDFEDRNSNIGDPNVVDGDEQIATATGVAEVMRDGDYQRDLKIPEPRPKETIVPNNQETDGDELNYSRTKRSQEKQKKGGLIAFLKRLFFRQK
ncbi:hypothetical protein [Weissella koreensis]|uniref:Uncharacterized protein n=1 Tax=Weissella koreensis TaxID=165096 RepID=A0A7H1MKR3_9LACO|nr:hypothetical protein [Weissella koreensis]AEJ23202.1 hypothetical protein WKK_01630 [Weissella koreensis KACC 15510]AVH74846.1 hypothetical protein C4597_01900 [Weissella koreensis]EJF33804.1 hypothetical protein JC2156_06180 [Weissella koreensis KCTC 3621]QNT64049.1 hypothetical protein FY536_01600 [Weissella koreensis]